jgi:hypothetical protein
MGVSPQSADSRKQEEADKLKRFERFVIIFYNLFHC